MAGAEQESPCCEKHDFHEELKGGRSGLKELKRDHFLRNSWVEVVAQ